MTFGLCKYRDVLGVPGRGFHSARLFGFARNDLLGTLFIAFLIALLFYRKKLLISFLTLSVILLIVGILLHRLFCVNTTLNKMIFGSVRYPTP